MARKKPNNDPNQLDLFKDKIESLGEEFDRVSESIADAILNKIKKAIESSDDSSKQFLERFKRNVKAIADSSGALLSIEQKLEAGLAKQRDFDNARLKIIKERSKIRTTLNKAIKEEVGLSNELKEAAQEKLKTLNAEEESITAIEKNFNTLNSKTNLFATLLAGAGKTLTNLGIDNPFAKINDNINQTSQEIIQLESQISQAQKPGSDITTEELGTMKKTLASKVKERDIGFQINKGLTQTLTRTNLIQGLIVGITASVGKLNQEQVKFQRITGEGVKNIRNARLEASTLAEVIEQAASAAEQFGFNIQETISGENIAAATDLVQGLGLSAEEANTLLLLSQNLNADLMDVANAANDVLDPSISTRAVFQDIVKSSAQTKVLFQSNAVAMAKTANDARLLGLNLANIESLSKNILDIESSIAAEFEAELLTGQQLELGRARLFALQGDLAGVTAELAKNQELFNNFGEMNVVQQQAIADALGLGVEELSQSILLQKELGDLTDKQRKRRQLDEKIAITSRESIAKSFQTITQQFAILIEPLVRGFAGALKFTILMVDGFKLLSPLLAGVAITMGIINAKAIATAIATGITALFTNPLAAAAILTGGTLAIAGLVKRSTDVELAQGGIVTGPTRALIGEAGPEAVIPLDRFERNRGLSRGDIKAISSAVRDGASQANINLDGGRVSSRLQVPNIINQRQYSI